MALRGSLEDMDVFELVQFPHQGRKSGELILVGSEHEARLYYQKGKLVHARYLETKGLDVLVEVLGWSEGVFEFRPNEDSPETSIEMDLHRAVMQALKIKDEKTMTNEAGENDSENLVPEKPDTETGMDIAADDTAKWANFKEAAQKEKPILSAVLVNESGQCLARAGRNKSDNGLETEKVKDFLLQYALDHPRPGMKRIITEDAGGTVVMIPISRGMFLVALAGKDASLGAASLSANRLAEFAERKGEPR